MEFQVIHTAGQVRLCGEASAEDIEAVNRFLAHLAARAFSPATVRAYAFDLLNFLRFCADRELVLGRVSAVDLFDYLDWQANPVREASQPVVRLREPILVTGRAGPGVPTSGVTALGGRHRVFGTAPWSLGFARGVASSPGKRRGRWGHLTATVGRASPKPPYEPALTRWRTSSKCRCTASAASPGSPLVRASMIRWCRFAVCLGVVSG